MAINPYDKWPQLDLKPLDFGPLMQAQKYINDAEAAKFDRQLKAYDDLSKLRTTHIQMIPGSIDEARQKAIEDQEAVRLNEWTDQFSKGKIGYKQLMLNLSDSKNKIGSPEAMLGNENFKSWAESKKLLDKMAAEGQGYNPALHADFLKASDFDSTKGHRWTKSPQAYLDAQVVETLYNNMTPLEDAATGASYITEDMLKQHTEKNLPYIMSQPFTYQQIQIARSKGDTRPDVDIARDVWFNKSLEFKQQHFPTPKTASSNDGGGGPTTPAAQVNPSYITGSVQTAIIPEDEAAKAQQATVAATYKTSNPQFINDHLSLLAPSLPSLRSVDAAELNITRKVNPEDNKIDYSIGMTEDQYVNKFPPNQQSSARSDYRLMANSFNNQGIQEQHLANLHTKAVSNVANRILGDPAKSPASKQMHDYVNAIENYGELKGNTKTAVDSQINALKEEFLKQKATREVGDPPQEMLDPIAYKAESARVNSSLASGIIPQDFKAVLYENMADRSSSFSSLRRFTEFASPDSDEISKEYATLYEQDQSKDYNVVTFSPETTTKEKWNDLQKYQYELSQGLESTKDGETAGGVRGATYYITGSYGEDGLPVGEYTSVDLFGPTGTKAQAIGVKTQGFIYDKENGWFLKGTLQGVPGKAGGGEEVLVKVPGMDEKIINNLTANPDAAHFTTLVGTLLQAMPNNEIDSSQDFKVDKIFSKFGMNDVYITGGENMGGYRISYKPEPDVAQNLRVTNPSMLDANGYLSYNFSSLQDLGNFVSNYSKNFGTGKK